MRLGQLARKIQRRPSEIVDFLARHQIQIDAGGNTRLEEDHVAMIMGEFAPGWVEEKDTQSEESGEMEITSVEEPTATAENARTVDENLTPDPALAEETKIELIKAPKVELSGLKVVGKIELPEIKKKETPPEAKTEAATPVRSQPDSRKPFPQRRVQTRPAKNPVALQRERDAAAAAEKRRIDIEREKEKRALHYHKKVKASPPTKRISLVEEPVEEFSPSEMEESPKTWWGKFIKWLNS